MADKQEWGECLLKIEHPPLEFKDEAALERWLTEKSVELESPWLLAFAEDGVIWGLVEKGELYLSSAEHTKVSPKLRLITLQSLRLFGAEAELLLWREGHGFKARILKEGGGEPRKFRDYELLLWGAAEESQEPAGRFRLMTEGAQGFLHAPPVAAQRAKLIARDYLDHDHDTGQALIRWNRLTGLKEGGK